MTEIFLGEPPTNIKQWIIDHATPPGPAGHAETWYKYEGDTEWRTVSITGIRWWWKRNAHISLPRADLLP